MPPIMPWSIGARGGAGALPGDMPTYPLGSQQNPHTVGGLGKAGEWFQGSRPGQWGHPTPQILPPDIEQRRGLIQKYQSYPSGYQFTPQQEEFKRQWEGVFNTPEPEPGGFNVGPRMASVPGGEMGPSAPWGGWNMAQAEQSPWWDREAT